MADDPGTIRVTRSVSIRRDEIELRVSRSSGPGGQHANVTASRVEASFDVSASETLTAEQRALFEEVKAHFESLPREYQIMAQRDREALERLGVW